MRIYLNNRNMKYENNDRVICFENDSDVVEFVCVVEDSTPLSGDWEYKLDIEAKVDGSPFYNTISLKEEVKGVYKVFLKAGMLPRGKNIAQIRRVSANKTYVSECFELWVKKSVLGFCTAYQEHGFIPSEFYQIEQTLKTVNNNPPIPDKTGFWRVYDTEIGDYVISDIPVIDQTIYKSGNGIEMNDKDEISVKVDNKSVMFNEYNELYVETVDGGYI